MANPSTCNIVASQLRLGSNGMVVGRGGKPESLPNRKPGWPNRRSTFFREDGTRSHPPGCHTRGNAPLVAERLGEASSTGGILLLGSRRLHR